MIINNFIKKYREEKKPISVEFRKLVPDDFKPTRFTHSIHTYPAKLIPHIPYVFLTSKTLLPKKGKVLDPFSGSGTVLLEAFIQGHKPFGADSNPLARKISKVKLTPIDKKVLDNSLKFIIKNIPKKHNRKLSTDIDVKYWFYPNIIKQLNTLFKSIYLLEEGDIKDFFLVCYSSCIKYLSLADQRVSVPVKMKKNKFNEDSKQYKELQKKTTFLENVNVIDFFQKRAEINIGKINDLRKTDSFKNKLHIAKDARGLTYSNNRKWNKNSIDLIITSPPYAGAQKYIRSSSLQLTMLDLLQGNNLKNLKILNIGREDYLKTEYMNLIKTDIPKADKLLKKIFKINPLRA